MLDVRDLETRWNKYNKKRKRPLYIGISTVAILIFAIINMIVGKDMTPAVIDEVLKDSPAFVSGMKGLAIVYKISKKSSGLNSVTLILAGIVLNIITSSIISFLKYYFFDRYICCRRGSVILRLERSGSRVAI